MSKNEGNVDPRAQESLVSKLVGPLIEDIYKALE